MKYFNSIKTERLLIRPFSKTDNIEKMNWFFEPSVMSQTISGVENDFKSLKRRIDRYIDHQSTFGYSKWLVIEKKSGAFIGDCGIVSMTSGSQIINDIGFRLASQYWAKGLGSEMTKSWIRAYFIHFSYDLLYAHAEPDNIRSKQLLSKLGFSYEESVSVFGAALDRYSLDRSSWSSILKSDKSLL